MARAATEKKCPRSAYAELLRDSLSQASCNSSVGWIDAFSRELVVHAADAPGISLADLYTDVYRGTAGSHASIYNTDEAGRLSTVAFAEFIAP